MDLIAFLKARLDEDEATWQREKAEGLGADTPWMVDRMLREVEAKRAILAAVEAIPHRYVEDCYYSCELAVSPDFPEEGPGSGYCNDNAIRTGGCTCGRDGLVSRLLAPLAAVYSGHPDFDPAWATQPSPGGTEPSPSSPRP